MSCRMLLTIISYEKSSKCIKKHSISQNCYLQVIFSYVTIIYITTFSLNNVLEAFGKHSSNLAVSLYKQLQLAFFLFLWPPLSYAQLSTPPPAENVWWFDLNFLPQRCVQPTYNYCTRNAVIDVCCSIYCVDLPSTSQQMFPKH